jgi:hypothetical protein
MATPIRAAAVPAAPAVSLDTTTTSAKSSA